MWNIKGISIKFLIISCVLLWKHELIASEKALNRHKRYLYFPFGGTFKLVLGFAVPVKLGLKQNMACGWNIQFQYALPQTTNDTRIYPPVIGGRLREKRNLETVSDRALAYMGLESILNKNGFNGKQCLLRAICENAKINIFHEANGLYGHLLDIFLTPDYGEGKADPNLPSEYLDAKEAGKFEVDCMSLYTECKETFGILDLITVVDY